MDMDQLQKNLDVALEELDTVIKERNKLKIKLEDAQDFIQKMKEEIETPRMKKKETCDQIKDCEVVSRLKKENEILEHGLGITNLKMNMMEDEKKSQSYLKSENTDQKSKLTKVTFEIEATKL